MTPIERKRRYSFKGARSLNHATLFEKNYAYSILDFASAVVVSVPCYFLFKICIVSATPCPLMQ